jgi:hypothetical protein
VIPISALVVAFMLLHSVSKCKKCLNMLICLVDFFGKFSYFLEYFLFSEIQNYLGYLKIFSKVLNMFFRSLDATSCLGSFLDFFEPSRYFRTLKRFQLFSGINFNFKNGIITKNKISSHPSNIYIYGWNPLVEPFPNLETISPDSIHNSRNCSPKFRVVPTLATTPTSNYFQYVHCRQNLRVLLSSSHRELRPGAFDLSIQPMVRCQSTFFFSAPTRSSPVSPPSIVAHEVLCFFDSRSCSNLPSPPSSPPTSAPYHTRF